MNTFIVTTCRKVNRQITERAERAAKQLKAELIPRQDRSLEELQQELKAAAVLVVKKNSYVLAKSEGEFFFHPSMAHLRIKNFRRGEPDHMVEAMGLEAGMEVLDCTLGFGSDAIVASFAVGETGRVTGLESSSLIAFVVGAGLQELVQPSPVGLEAAMRRIRVVPEDYMTYLKVQADNSVDVVYFDPMFRCPLSASAAIAPLRELADHRPVTKAALAEACRVARRRVVLKEAFYSQEFSRLGFPRVSGGKYSRIHYGIIDVEKWTGMN